MSKIIRKQNKNTIIDSLDIDKYATTSIDYSCNVNGPNCEENIDDDQIWKSDWKDASEFGRNDHYSYDFHICPYCQKTNCMKCMDGILDDNGRCNNEHCEDHDYCKECGEEYFQDMHGEAYCINPDCEKNNETKRKEAAALRLATKNYWVQCDGPDCESDGWNPEYDRMPEGWHRNEHDSYGEHTTDYCKDCWNNAVCHECEEPYRDDELKQEFINTDSQVCHNPSCYMHNKCFCGSEVDKFGNCLDEKNYDASGDKKYLDGYCERGSYCRQCDTNSRNNDHHECYNPECIAYVEPKCDHEGCNKKTDIDYDGYNNYYGGGYDWERERYHYCKEHKPLHCTETIEPAYGYDRIYPGCGKLLNSDGQCSGCHKCGGFKNPHGRCEKCNPSPYDGIDWGFDKQAHYTYVDDPQYPDYLYTFENCDYPGCKRQRCVDNTVLEKGWGQANNPRFADPLHFCPDHDGDYCSDCGSIIDHEYRCTDPMCKRYKECRGCGMNTLDKNGICTDEDCMHDNYFSPESPREHIYCDKCREPLTISCCLNKNCSEYKNPLSDAFFPKKTAKKQNNSTEDYIDKYGFKDL